MSESLPVAGTAVILRDAPSGVEVLLIRRPARGSFAGAWVFPGGKVEDADRVAGAAPGDGAERADAERAAVRETEEEVGLAITGLTPLSRWEPPIGVPTRIRTWFFLAEAQAGELRPSPDEVVDATWIAPAQALSRHATGDLLLFPPTWVTLDRLTAFDDVASAFAAVDAPAVFTTRMDGKTFLWGDDRLETAELPWRYVRD